MPVPLLITRALNDWEGTTYRLPPEWDPVSAPTVEYQAAGRPDVLASRAPNRPILCVTTPRSVRVAVLLAPGRTVWALAPRTSAELIAAGLSVHTVEGGATELMALVDPAQSLLLTSDIGAARARRTWPDLEVLVTHFTACPTALPFPARAVLAGTTPYDVLLASPSAAENLEQLAPGALRAARRVLCHGSSTLTTASRLGAAAEPFNLGA
ncbi:hypothetical protein LBMAG42_24600 [Deltaproteobacteria bacterium]|nr:hypothetical protein LBMAG42_24600 [Deltaproteobacteria bacterium]